ncbi:MAG: N-acetylmuramoyl-L-alanine amidase [Nitrospinaceae bacterium]
MDIKKVSVVYIYTLFIFLVFVWGPAAEAGKNPAASAEALYQKARKDYYALMGSKNKQALRHHWTRCIDKFLDVSENYPDDPNSYKALFTVGRLYHKLYQVARNPGDLDRALRYYQKVAGEFKTGRLTDDALFHQGEVYREKKDFSSALALFEKIVKEHPGGDQAKRAGRNIREIAPLAEKKSSPAVLKKVSYFTRPDSTRIVLHTSKPVRYSYGRLSNPDRVYLNLFNARLDQGLFTKLDVKDRVLKQIRVSQFDHNTSRLVLDIHSLKGLAVVPTQSGSSVVLELSVRGGSQAAAGKAVKPQAVKTARASLPPVSPAPKKGKEKKIPLVVIDPGHGGKDFGAQSPNGLVEKDVNLKVSKRLKRILETRYKYRVLITRLDDTFIPLEERGAMANSKQADIFVSVHANAARRRAANGIETYFLGTANSEQAQETAARENGELVHSVKDDQVQQILASLISTTKINDSSRLAAKVQEGLYSSMKKKYSGVKDLGVKEGPFFVLHDTNMPSILVEIGFITNPREEIRLRNAGYLNRLADAIARGVHRYLRERAPTI